MIEEALAREDDQNPSDSQEGEVNPLKTKIARAKILTDEEKK